MVKKSPSPDKHPKMEWWKIAFFCLGILLVAGAATYAVTTRSSAASGSVTNSSVPAIQSTLSPGASLGVGDLSWAQNLTLQFADHDLVFVMLPDNDAIITNTLAKRISDAAAKIEARGARVYTLTLKPDDPEFSTTVQRLTIGSLPAVLTIASSGQGAILTGDITEGQLLQVYLVVSQPVCPPGSGSGCCPK
ncbi:MAG TPA: hypothetical protein VF366_07940 [Dehalococcoidia bacterium]